MLAKRLEANGLFESSRMVLPEHTRRLVQQSEIDKQGGPRRKPLLDEQEQALISAALHISRIRGNELTVHVWGRAEPLIGAVTRFDQYHQRITIAGVTVPVNDIVKVEGYKPSIRFDR